MSYSTLRNSCLEYRLSSSFSKVAPSLAPRLLRPLPRRCLPPRASQAATPASTLASRTSFSPGWRQACWRWRRPPSPPSLWPIGDTRGGGGRIGGKGAGRTTRPRRWWPYRCSSTREGGSNCCSCNSSSSNNNSNNNSITRRCTSQSFSSSSTNHNSLTMAERDKVKSISVPLWTEGYNSF